MHASLIFFSTAVTSRFVFPAFHLFSIVSVTGAGGQRGDGGATGRVGDATLSGGRFFGGEAGFDSAGSAC